MGGDPRKGLAPSIHKSKHATYLRLCFIYFSLYGIELRGILSILGKPFYLHTLFAIQEWFRLYSFFRDFVSGSRSVTPMANVIWFYLFWPLSWPVISDSISFGLGGLCD